MDKVKVNSFSDFLDLFPDKPRQKIANGYNVICPAHADRNPSLSVSLNGNKILLYCQTGCTTEAILDALNQRHRNLNLTMPDLFLGDKPVSRRQIVATYDYHDELGNLLYQILRYKPKEFSVSRPDGKGGHISGLGDVRKVIYNLPKVKETIKNDKDTYIVEGEKDANSLNERGLVATTSPFGAGKWLDQYSESLRGGGLVLIPHNDPEGIAHMRDVARKSQGIVKSIKLLKLEGLAAGGDVGDWLDRGGTAEYLEELIADLKEYDPEKSMEYESIGDITYFKWPDINIGAEISIIRENYAGIHAEVVFHALDKPDKPYTRSAINLLKPSEKTSLINNLKRKQEATAWHDLLEEASEEAIKRYREGEEVVNLLDIERPQRSKYRLYPFIEESEVTTFYGAHEGLKSYLMYYDSVLIQNGLEIEGVRAEQGNVLILDFETHKFTGSDNIRALIKGLGKSGLKSPVYRRCVRPIPLDILNIQKLIREYNIQVVFVDSVGMSCGGDANSQEVMTSYYRALRSLNITVVTIDHEPREGNNVYGSVYKEIIARDVFEISRRDTNDNSVKFVIIKHSKANNRARIPTISFKFEFDGEEDYTDSAIVTREAAPEVATIFGSDEAKDKIVDYFKRTQNIADMPKNIAIQTGIKNSTARSTLTRWKNKVFERLEDGRWKLILLV